MNGNTAMLNLYWATKAVWNTFIMASWCNLMVDILRVQIYNS